MEKKIIYMVVYTNDNCGGEPETETHPFLTKKAAQRCMSEFANDINGDIPEPDKEKVVTDEGGLVYYMRNDAFSGHTISVGLSELETEDQKYE